MTSLVLALLLFSTASASVLGLLILLLGLQRVFGTAPELRQANDPAPETSLTVVIPAYNEADNIQRCLSSVLASEPPAADWQVLVVDDESSDATSSVARATAAASDCPERFNLLSAGPRPTAERWVGKNWACSRAMEQVNSTWVLFIDADVKLAPTAMRRALNQAIEDRADLLSLAPRLVCGCLAEWMVQPIMACLLGLGFPIKEANDPNSPVAFAAGPFMLFRLEAYKAIGGHHALAGEVVEDLALARRIKQNGLRLRYLLGLDAVDLQMYSDLASLWEGWSKNWFLGLDRNIPKALSAGAVVLLLFSGPWLLLPGSAVLGLLLNSQGQWFLASGLLALIGICLQLALRLWTHSRFAVPLDHWWLMGAGGLLVAAIAPNSVYRSLSGRGWTWKGRSLAD
ncbi:MAG TPA: glycosyltransferase family 2 protein [Prochlorococcaceae cyanobacterium Fu_MAG_50]|nr:glycosyltransferase family 2 protein [Prochlorococcaceae cyanobacterium Fu_MAG_50]